MIKDPLPLPPWATAQLHKTLIRHAVPSFGSMLTWLPFSWDASIRRDSLMGIGKQSFRIKFKCPWLHETNSGISGKTNQALFEALEHFLVLGLLNLFSHVHSQCWSPSEKLIMLWSFLKTKTNNTSHVPDTIQSTLYVLTCKLHNYLLLFPLYIEQTEA